MRYINVDDDYVKSVFEANSLEESTPIQESKAVDTESQEVIEEAEEHVCPLCETELSEAISEDSWNACVDTILGVINEVTSEEGEDLSESDEDEIELEI
tara:strand:+ start:590 stop:886 length:297 start_codon:yes stop_codon:yes gene_type:complete